MPKSNEREALSDGVDPDRARMLASGGGGKDPVQLVTEVNHQAGCDLSLVGVAEHGVSGGAVYVQWPDGRNGVITRSPASVARMEQTAEVLAEARAAGLPVPLHDLVVELGRRRCARSGALTRCACQPGGCRCDRCDGGDERAVRRTPRRSP